jgi:hypothetical protein
VSSPGSVVEASLWFELAAQQRHAVALQVTRMLFHVNA